MCRGTADLRDVVVVVVGVVTGHSVCRGEGMGGGALLRDDCLTLSGCSPTCRTHEVVVVGCCMVGSYGEMEGSLHLLMGVILVVGVVVVVVGYMCGGIKRRILLVSLVVVVGVVDHRDKEEHLS